MSKNIRFVLDILDANAGDAEWVRGKLDRMVNLLTRGETAAVLVIIPLEEASFELVGEGVEEVDDGH